MGEVESGRAAGPDARRSKAIWGHHANRFHQCAGKRLGSRDDVECRSLRETNRLCGARRDNGRVEDTDRNVVRDARVRKIIDVRRPKGSPRAQAEEMAQRDRARRDGPRDRMSGSCR